MFESLKKLINRVLDIMLGSEDSCSVANQENEDSEFERVMRMDKLMLESYQNPTRKTITGQFSTFNSNGFYSFPEDDSTSGSLISSAGFYHHDDDSGDCCDEENSINYPMDDYDSYSSLFDPDYDYD